MTDATVYQDVIIGELPLIDLRAPVEFCSGSLPGAVNLPILDDEERHRVGTCYKQHGKDKAIKLGSRLVSGEIRSRRVSGWIEMLSGHAGTMIYCARGGQRSHIAQEWIEAQSGQSVGLLEGGYKAFRSYLLERLHPQWITSEAIVLGGRTGVGKTILIKRLKNSIDLEALANHRGSSFGRHISAQPVQADFENRLAAALVRHGHLDFRYMIVEDEGRHIGKRFLPKPLAQFFADGQLIIVEAPLERRIEITFDEYVVAAQQTYQQQFGVCRGMEKWIVEMESGVDRIARRLGSALHQRVKEQLGDACRAQKQSGNMELHKIWVGQLLSCYYDPMYDFQLAKDRRTILFKGSPAEVEAYLASIE